MCILPAMMLITEYSKWLVTPSAAKYNWLGLPQHSVSLCTCIYVCMYVYMYVCMAQAPTGFRKPVHMQACMYVYVCMYGSGSYRNP